MSLQPGVVVSVLSVRLRNPILPAVQFGDHLDEVLE
jgi:hypothetical protein